MDKLDLRCYFVTGAGPDVVSRARAAALGGAGVIQVRSKPISARDLFELSRAVAREVKAVRPRTRVLVDDRVDIALALRDDGVDGVHLGQDDLDVRLARELLGRDAIIGLTTGTLELIRAANEVASVIDYIGAGPFRATPTKDSGRCPLGLEGYPPLVAASAVPLVAIGDVTADDARDLARAGVDGVALVRGIMNAPDPEAYTARVVAEFDRGATSS
ncbi:thiamine phosphate synthase [Corynebacterium liangguodongii]|uniref:Thiamine-phosphate synthase n=1 Tax=Corynebacterium liangguodongii TaxID=2079535 RepID=A0A2S0WCU1_9CORY|nr:thiamine phosphate synthase [Corynebacterium liangguodongii]AWB83588.1 thiamine phosphate synthase [Corynebacterium liangguodongii]PWB98620.1 thiamine phosphate synthase [Corynebacterium liangguodongii]